MDLEQGSIFDVLRKESLNRATLQVGVSGDFILMLSKKWDDGLSWREYNKTFYVDSLLTKDVISLNHEKSLEIINRYGLNKYLNSIVEMMLQGGHERIEFFYYLNKNVRFINCIHSTKAGIPGTSRALVMGGIRRHPCSTSEIYVIEDGLNLSRAMTVKNKFADIPCGGCKITVHADQVDLSDLDEIGFLAYSNDCCKNVAGPDVNYPVELADVVRANFSRGFAGGRDGQLGPTGKPTALGTFHAIRAAMNSLDKPIGDFSGLKIAIQGLGSVGFSLAELLLDQGCNLTVTDVNEDTFLDLTNKYPSSNIEFVSPNDIYEVDADIFSPCATGGVITKDRIEKFKFRMIIGPANNQLKAISRLEEMELAELLEGRGILFLPDWLHNMGGVLTGYEEYEKGDSADMSNVIRKVEKLAFSGINNIIVEAKKKRTNPLKVAYSIIGDL